MLTDLMAGKKIDPAQTYNYGIRPKLLTPFLDPNGTGVLNPGAEAVDPRGYTPYDLYNSMHNMGSGHYQEGGTGNSGYSDAQIDEMFGPDKDKLAKSLGVSALPDWSKQRYDDAPAMQDILAAQNKPWDDKWNAMDAAAREPYVRKIADSFLSPSNNDPTNARDLWQRDQERAEIDKMLSLNDKVEKLLPNEGKNYNFG